MPSRQHIHTDDTFGGDLTGPILLPALAASGVTAGSYTNANITVDSKGRVTAASTGSGGGASSPTQMPTQTSNFTVSGLNNLYPVNASAGNVTATLPTSTTNQNVYIKKLDASAATGATSGIVILSGVINGTTQTTVPLRKINQAKRLVADGNGGWTIVGGDLDITSLYASAVEPGTVQLTGDLGGTPQSPTVPGLSGKQATLVSGTNIKTVNGSSLLGSGDLTTPTYTPTDATTTAKGIVQLAGDLGGTAASPTTPTAVHITGTETVAGAKTLTDALTVQTGTGATSGIIYKNTAGITVAQIRNINTDASPQGVIEFYQGTTPTLAGRIQATGSNALFINSVGGSSLDLAINGSTKLRVESSGTLGTWYMSQRPQTNNVYDIGTSGLYWANLYATKQYLNSTTYFDGATSGQAVLTGSLGIGGSPLAPLQVTGSSQTAGPSTADLFILDRPFNAGVFQGRRASIRVGALDSTSAGAGRLDFAVHSSGLAAGATTLPDTTVMTLGGNGLVGIGTVSPTHTLTLPSSGTGIALYNTADQTTNYERIVQYWSGNAYYMDYQSAGTGSNNRAIYIRNPSTGLISLVSNTSSISINDSNAATGKIRIVGGASGSALYGIRSEMSHNATTAINQVHLSLAPTINQSTSVAAGYTALLINVTETNVGTANKLLQDWQVGGVSKSTIDNTGKHFVTGLQVGTATTAGYVLTADASGNATWQAATGGGGSGYSRVYSAISAATTGGTQASTDYKYKWTGSTAYTLTLPDATAIGRNEYTVKNLGTISQSVATTSGQTIDGSATATVVVNQALTFASDGANWMVI